MFSPQNGDELVIQFDLTESKGSLFIGIYNSDQDFMKKSVADSIVEVNNKKMLVRMAIPKGDYAISVFHDLNGNGVLDTHLFGIPKEPYGFSNNARGTMGPPSFEDCTFSFEGEKTIDIMVN
jgi:uncharacterized protein (DUF2141 family)